MARKKATTKLRPITINFCMHIKQPILGSAPASDEIYLKYLVSKLDKEIEKLEKKLSKCKSETEKILLEEKLSQLKYERENLPVINTNDPDNRLTIFYRYEHPDYGIIPVIRAHQILGAIKETANTIKDDLGIPALKSKVNKYIIEIDPVNILMYRDPNFQILIEDVDGIYERPIRAMTPQGERVSISRSEIIKDPIYCKFTLRYMDNSIVPLEVFKQILDYTPIFAGIGQWRNSKEFGKFTWDYEIIEWYRILGEVLKKDLSQLLLRGELC